MVQISSNGSRWQVAVHQLSDDDCDQLNDLVSQISKRYFSAADERFLATASLLSHSLPLAVRRFLTEARELEHAPAYVVSAPRLIGDVGRTPDNWWNVDEPVKTRREEFVLVLLSSLLGDVFAWATQQAGRMIHDVLPIRGQEHEQLGSGSITPLSWHTEDAFHPFRGDYVGLACMRNPDGVATTLLSVDGLELPAHVVERLRERRFIIVPDNSHLAKNNPGVVGDVERFSNIDEMFSNPQPVAALFGERSRQYLRADPDFMSAVPGDEVASTDLELLFEAIEQSLEDVVLEAGDFLFIDNYRCAHGRRSFVPHFDGLDRWLKRVNVSRDLRPARAAGTCRGFRMMY